ncbi:MAG: hypothetical protein V4550_21030 [Gemmatimonadota bacterium]
MDDRKKRVLESWRRIVGSGASLSTLAPEVPAILERLASTVAEIDMYKQQQFMARKLLLVTHTRRALDRMRTEHMLPLARLTRPLFVGMSGIEAAIRVPHKRAPTEEILAAAEAMVKALRPHRELIAKSKIDPTRIDCIRDETRLLKKRFRTAYAASADRGAPTRQLPALFASARMDVAMLDALVRATSDAAQVFLWKQLSRVQKRLGRPRRKRGTNKREQAA